jgi:hypothetical protein
MHQGRKWEDVVYHFTIRKPGRQEEEQKICLSQRALRNAEKGGLVLSNRERDRLDKRRLPSGLVAGKHKTLRWVGSGQANGLKI